MKKVLFILLGCLLSFNVMAQVKAISGLVTDVTGEPVIGASVVEVGTTNGVITDLNGKFSLKVAPNSQFLVSYIGYKQQTIKVGSESTYNIVLKEDAEVFQMVYLQYLLHGLFPFTADFWCPGHLSVHRRES